MKNRPPIILKFKNNHKTIDKLCLNKFNKKIIDYLNQNYKSSLKLQIIFIKENDFFVTDNNNNFFLNRYNKYIKIKIHEDSSLIEILIKIKQTLNIDNKKIFKKIPDLFNNVSSDRFNIKFCDVFQELYHILFEYEEEFNIVFNEKLNKDSLFIFLLKIVFYKLKNINDKETGGIVDELDELKKNNFYNLNLPKNLIDDNSNNKESENQTSLAKTIFILNSDLINIPPIEQIKEEILKDLFYYDNEVLFIIQQFENRLEKLKQANSVLYEKYYLIKNNSLYIDEIRKEDINIINELHLFKIKINSKDLTLLDIALFNFGFKNNIINIISHDKDWSHEPQYCIKADSINIELNILKLEYLENLKNAIIKSLPEFNKLVSNRTDDTILYGNSGTGKTYLASQEKNVILVNNTQEMYLKIFENNISFISFILYELINVYYLMNSYKFRGNVLKINMPEITESIIFIDEFNRNNKNEILHDLVLFDRDYRGFSKLLKYTIDSKILNFILDENLNHIKMKLNSIHLNFFNGLFEDFLMQSLNIIYPEQTENKILNRKIVDYLIGKEISNESIYIFSTPNIVYKFAINLADINTSKIDLMFNRRVGFQYVPYNPSVIKTKYNISVNYKEEKIDWLLIQQALNKVIITYSHESKCLGYYFWTKESINFSEFKSKIIYHIYNSVLSNTNNLNYKYNIGDSNISKFFTNSSYEKLISSNSIKEIFNASIIADIFPSEILQEHKFKLKKDNI